MCCSWNAILIVPFYKSQDTLLHPGLNELIQNTSFIEVQRYWHVTVALLGGFDWQPGSGSADFNWSALVNHIGIQLLPATQSTLIGHAQYIKPRPSQFSVQHGNGEFYWIRLFYGNGVTIPNHYHIVSFSGVVVWPKWQKIAIIIRYFVGTSQVIFIQSSDWQAILCMLKYQWKTAQSTDF